MALKIKVDKGVPMDGAANERTSWPFGGMEIGDSFEIPVVLYSQASTAASKYGKKHKMRFTRRKNRIWRIK